MTRYYDYSRDGTEIYEKSFETIRLESDLSRFSEIEARVAVRMIHACGMIDLAGDLRFSPGFADAARAALHGGAPILCDANMIASGITRSRLPADNEVICTLEVPAARDLARSMETTRSAAAVDLWRDRMAGAVVAIGNAPTALFRLLELLDEGAPAPAAVIGVPVGFVGAAESKEALEARADLPHVIVRGRRGGSAMATAAVNALASDRE